MERRRAWKARRNLEEIRCCAPSRISIYRGCKRVKSCSPWNPEVLILVGPPHKYLSQGLFLWAEFVRDFIQAGLSVAAAADCCLNASCSRPQKTHFQERFYFGPFGPVCSLKTEAEPAFFWVANCCKHTPVVWNVDSKGKTGPRTHVGHPDGRSSSFSKMTKEIIVNQSGSKSPTNTHIYDPL